MSSRGFNGSFLTFNSLNGYILKGNGAFGMDLTFATLMVRSGNEPDAMYGLAARGVRISDDGLTYTFVLRPEAKFHDGSPLTAHDVAWSLTTLKDKGHPLISQRLRDMKGAEARRRAHGGRAFRGEARARRAAVRRRPADLLARLLCASIRSIESTLDIPLGSGGYKVGKFSVGRFIEFERVKDWWGADLPVARGQSNFDIVRYEYYRDREVGFEGFTAGSYLFREEFTSRIWATRYNFPAFKQGRVKRSVIPDDTPSGAQGWFINTRRKQFQDRRLREALIDCFDFEWTNKNLMYGSYDRTQSVFENSPMKAVGMPSPAELKLLEPFRGKVPDEVFGEPYVPPVTDGSGHDRRWLLRGARLLNEAGYRPQGRQARAAGRHADLDRIPDRGADLQAAPPRLHEEPRHDRPPLDLAHRRSGAISRARRQFRLRHHGGPLQLFLDAGRIAAQLFLLAGGPASKARRTSPASPSRPWTRWSTRPSPPRRARNSSPPAGRSTACSAPAAIGSRTGTKRRIGSPIGTCSGSRPPNRAISAVFRRPGGTIPRRRRKST